MERKPETTAFWVGRLPHWEVEEGRYFVTIHLSGAIPVAGQRRILEISAGLRQSRTGNCEERLRVQRAIFREMEAWLDRAERNAYLGQSIVVAMVVEAIHHRSQLRIWNMFEYVVMPTHVHLFFELNQGRLKDSLEDFKQWTGRKAGALVGLDGRRFWQREWFDHWSRSDEEDGKIITYIQRNPVKAGLVCDYLDWPYGSWSLR